jgi:hypothetical protein
MNMENQATPRPWASTKAIKERGFCAQVFGPDGHSIAVIDKVDDEGTANAELIVTAVNAYDQLRADNERLQKTLNENSYEFLNQWRKDAEQKAEKLEKENAELKAKYESELYESFTKGVDIKDLRESLSQLIPIAEGVLTDWQQTMPEFKPQIANIESILLKAKEAIK